MFLWGHKKEINFVSRSSPENPLLYLVLITVHIGLIWLLPYFPTQDGTSHIYNLVILKDLLNGGMEWGSYFSYKLNATPNLAFNLISYPLLNFFPPLIAEKIFISIYIVLMGASVYLFLRTFNKTSLPFIYFVFPVILNFNLMMGFYSYVITVPLFLFAFSISWEIRNRSTVSKFIFFNLAGLIIFYFHLISFTFFLLSLICITFVQSDEFKKNIYDQIKLIFIMLPSLLVLFFYLAKSTKSFISDFSYLSSLSRYIYLRNDLFFFSTITFSPWQMLPGFLFVGLFLFFFISSVYTLFKDPNKGLVKFRDIKPSDKVLICLTFIFLLIYFITPFRFGRGDFFNQRFPWVVFIILLPLLQIDKIFFFERFVKASVISVAIIFFVFNAFIFWQQSNKVEKFLSGLNADIPKGAYVMTYKKIDPKAGMPRVDVLMHGASYYGIFKDCVNIGNYETGFDYFPIKFKANTPSFPSLDQIIYESETIDWPDYSSIQYLLGWEIDKNDIEKLSKFFHIIWQNELLSIWQRNSTNP
jgi:hypothetical protein